MLLRIFKYLINIATASLVTWIIYVSFAIITRIPNINNIMPLIWQILYDLLLPFIILIGTITILNWFWERKLEKRNDSKEFLFILFFHLTVFVISFIYFSNDFYSYCINNQY